MLCCVVHYSSLHTRVFLAIFFCSALRCVPFRAGQLNSTTFDLRMFDQLLLLLLLLPDCLPGSDVIVVIVCVTTRAAAVSARGAQQHV